MRFNREFEINEEQIADYLMSAADRVRTTENVDLLADLNKLFKKNVPLTVRKYVIAYMLKEALKHYHSFGNNRHGRNERNDRNNRVRGRDNMRSDRQDRSAELSAENAEELEAYEISAVVESEYVAVITNPVGSKLSPAS